MDFSGQLRAFEKILDEQLFSRPVYRCDANASLGLVANLHEAVANKGGEDFERAAAIHRGITVLADGLVSGRQGPEPEPGALAADIVFASHYYMVRDYLYYSYNVPESFDWSFGDKRVEIRFNDRTIPRQFFTIDNDLVLGSRDHFAGFGGPKEVRALLKGEREGQITEKVVRASAFLEKEVDLKLAAYFSILGTDADVDLGGFSYAQFIRLYRFLMGTALYHRYFAQANETPGAIYFVEEELVREVTQAEPSLSATLVRAMLNDIVFDMNAPKSRTDASYFSLLREGAAPGRIVLMPNHFAISEGLVNLLRVVAQRRPNTFLNRASTEIGAGFVQRVKAMFEAQGFICRSEVPLAKFDPKLPDIDLLVISEEPTLGYIIFVCELKSPLPPRWAKDQLKVLNKDSVSKAFAQAKAISSFLSTDEGIFFLRSLLPDGGLPHFDGFVIAIESLIITSDNAGMFFGKEKTRIINFRTLGRLLKRSDGDMAFIQHMLRNYNKMADEIVRTTKVEFDVGDVTVSYEGVTQSPLLDFPRVKWRTSPERQKGAEEFIASGLHPFDVFGAKKSEIKGITKIVFNDHDKD